MKLYRNIIKGSFRESLKHKYLWFFGLFAVLLGNGGEYEILIRSSLSENGTEFGSSFLLIFITQLIENFNNLTTIAVNFFKSPMYAMIVFGVYLLIIAIMIFVLWMVNVSQISIIDASAQRAKKKDHDIKRGMEKGMQFFWPVFALNAIVKVLAAVCVFFLATTVGGSIFIVVFIVTVPLLMSISFLVKYAIAYIVIRKEKLSSSIKLAWDMFSKNWLISLELGLLLYLYTFLAGILFLFSAFNIFKLFEVLVLSFKEASFYLLTVMMPLTLFLVLALIGSILAVFQITVWTKLFLRLEQEGGKSKIERVFSKE